MKRIEQILLTLNKAAIGLALAATFALVFVNVIGRYVFGTSLSWAEEVARFLIIFCTFAGAGIALREGRLVAIDMLLDCLPPQSLAVRAIRWLGVLLMAALMICLVWFGWQYVLFGWNKEAMATQIPLSIPYMALPLGGMLFLIHLAFFASRFVSGRFEHPAGQVEDTTDDETASIAKEAR